MRYDYSDEDLSLLAGFDTDSFNRWESMQRLGSKATEGFQGFPFRSFRIFRFESRIIFVCGRLGFTRIWCNSHLSHPDFHQKDGSDDGDDCDGSDDGDAGDDSDDSDAGDAYEYEHEYKFEFVYE